jgi:integrase/recombinase XerD
MKFPPAREDTGNGGRKKEETIMISQVITKIQDELSEVLDENQMKCLSAVLQKHLSHFEKTEKEDTAEKKDMLPVFIAAKRVEGCSEKSLRYYESTIRNMLESINKPECQITTEDLRSYLDTYQRRGTVSKVTLDNVRRILSSFFAWLEDEDYIVKSPVRRIHKVKTGKTVKETYTDESLEMMRDHCDNLRDLAMIDLLASTGIRVGELVKLNRSDVDFENRECIVFGKGNKERKVYFDARTKIHLQRYLAERSDESDALFVSLLNPFERLQISGVEIRLRKIGRELNFQKVHPHKFRRTLATMAIDKGMPIEQVQQLLGHQSIDTTLQYAMVNQNNVKESHRKYIG